MPLYKYVTAKTLRNILCSHTIRLTQPKSFNDPFEFLPRFSRINSDLDWIDGRFSFDLMAERRNNIEKPVDEFRSDKNSDSVAKDILIELNKAVGVLCLTKRFNNLLMWSHYCDDHKGAVIEFDENHQFFNGVIPVLYRCRRPLYDFSDFQNKTIPVADFCIKSTIWEYEEEVRVVKNLKNALVVKDRDSMDPKYLFSLPVECIKGITLGARMPAEQKKEIFELVMTTAISLDIAVVSDQDFALSVEPLKLEGTGVVYSRAAVDKLIQFTSIQN